MLSFNPHPYNPVSAWIRDFFFTSNSGQGRYNEAEPLYIQALALRHKLLGEEHPDVAQSLNNLAGLYNSQGRYSQAEPLYMQALDIFERRLGTNHPDTITVRNNLAHLRDRPSSNQE